MFQELCAISVSSDKPYAW